MKDRAGVIHHVTSTPGPSVEGNLVAGTTRCGRWWVWTSMKGNYFYTDELLEADYAFGALTCLVCVDGRRTG